MSERQLGEVQFLTVAEVASIMRVSKMTVYRMVHAGNSRPSASAGRSGCRRTRSTSTSAPPSLTPPERAATKGRAERIGPPFVVPDSQVCRGVGWRPRRHRWFGWRSRSRRLGSRRRPLTCARRTIHCHQQGMPHGFSHQKRRKRMAKKKHRKLLRKTRHQRRNRSESAALSRAHDQPHEPLPSGASSSVTCVAAGDRRPTLAGRVDQARTRPTRSQEAQ